jgi:hypothetical protein
VLSSRNLSYDVERAPLDFLEDSPNVLTNHADRDQLDAGQEENGHDQGREARRVQADSQSLDRIKDR